MNACVAWSASSQCDEHKFEDKMYYYRFYADEDKKYKQFWRSTAAKAKRGSTAGSVLALVGSGRWRFQPHVACNSSLLSIAVMDGLYTSWVRSDHMHFMHYLQQARVSTRQRTADPAGWRMSKYVPAACVAVVCCAYAHIPDPCGASGLFPRAGHGPRMQ